MRKVLAVLGILWLILSGSITIYGAEPEILLEELDFTEISQVLKESELQEKIEFEDIIRGIMGQDDSFSYDTIGEYIKHLIVGGMEANKNLCLELLIVCLAFSILKNFSKSFTDSYIGEICFLVCYCFMMILLLRSFGELNKTVVEATGILVDFMKVFVPTYCMSISFSLNLSSSGATYSLIFAVIYLVEWLICRFLVPLVQVYVIIEFLNHLMDQERFRKLAELIVDVIKFVLKTAVSIIFGINIIQGMVAPAMDRLTGNTVAKTLQMIPGLGNIMSSAGQILLSSGLVIKNCVGAAALIVLVLLCGIPFLKMVCLVGMYKLLAAVLEPVADKRILGGMSGIATGGALYVKILSTCLMLFFLTIALSSAATNLIAGG